MEKYIELKDSKYRNNLIKKVGCLEKLLKNIESKQPFLYEGFVNEYPGEYLDCLYNGRVLRENVDWLNSLGNVDYLNDVRTTEETIFNYYLGAAIETIAFLLIKSMNFPIERNGGDKDFLINQKKITTEADLLMPCYDVLIDVKSSRLLSEGLSIKEKQLVQYRKKNIDIFAIDYESSPGNIYFLWFTLDEIKLGKLFKQFNKQWYQIDCSNQELHYLDFTSNKDKVYNYGNRVEVQNSFKYKYQNALCW